MDAEEKDKLLKRLYDNRGYQPVVDVKEKVIARKLRADGFIKAVDTFEFAAMITEDGVVFHENGGYSGETLQRESSEKVARNRITNREIIAWTIAIIGVVATIISALL